MCVNLKVWKYTPQEDIVFVLICDDGKRVGGSPNHGSHLGWFVTWVMREYKTGLYDAAGSRSREP